MYLYATAPVKGIVGEAEVIGKLEKIQRIYGI